MSIPPYRVYDLGRPLEATTPVAPGHPNFRMALLRRHGDVVREDGSSSANELISLSGHTGTHVDAIAHFSKAGKLHGGVDAVEASRGGAGFTQLGVDKMEPIVCRGVLLDVPRAHGRESWGPGERIQAEHVEETCRQQGVEVRAGDAVLVRTGWPVGRFDDPVAFLGFESGVPGPDESAARWLAEQGIRQFIDIGSGLPTAGNTHEIVQAVAPDARVVYVDNDPMVALFSAELHSVITNGRDREPSMRTVTACASPVPSP